MLLVHLTASPGRSGFFLVSARPWASHLHSPHLISFCILKSSNAQCQRCRFGSPEPGCAGGTRQVTSQGQRPRHPHRTLSEETVSVWDLGCKHLLRTPHLQLTCLPGLLFPKISEASRCSGASPSSKSSP